MALKKKYATADAIPQELKALYRQEGNAFVLDLDGDGDSDDVGGDDVGRKLAEFRSNNRKLAAELKALQSEADTLRQRAAVLGDNDPEQVTLGLDLLAKLKNHEDEALIKAGRIDDVVARRFKAKDAEWQKRFEAETAKAAEIAAREAKAREMASGMVLEQRIRKAIAAKKVRVRSTAEDDLLARARRDWRVRESLDDLDPVDTAGVADPESWVDQMVGKAPHLFEGGDGGGTTRPAGPIVNGKRTVRRSELSDREYANILPDVDAGKVTVVP